MRRREPVRRPLNVPARVLLAARPRGVPPARPARARGAAARRCSRRRIPPGAHVGRAARARGGARGASASSASVNGAEQVICATGFLRGFQHDPLLARARRRARARDGRRLDRARTGLRPCPALTDDTRTLALAGVAGAVGLPGRRHARRRAVRRPRLPAKGQVVSYTLRGRIESRLAALAAGRSRPPACSPPRCTAGGRSSPPALMVGDRARARRRRSTTGCCPTSPAGRRCRSGCSSSALLLGSCALARHRGAALAGASRSSPAAGSSRSCSATQASRCCGSATPRTAASSAGSARVVGARRRRAARRRRRDRVRAAAAGRPPRRRRPPGPARDHRREVLVGEPGAIVRGGIVVRANGRDDRERHRRRRRERDHRRRRTRNACSTASPSPARSSTGSTCGSRGVMIKNCTVDMLGNPLGQGIDISYNMDMGMSMVEGCTRDRRHGGDHHALVDDRRSCTTASAGTDACAGSRDRDVDGDGRWTTRCSDAHGVGIFCNDRSMCMIEHNTVVGTGRTGPASGCSRASSPRPTCAGTSSDANPVPFSAIIDSQVATTH